MNIAPLKNLNRHSFTPEQIASLRYHYDKIEGIDPDTKTYRALIQLLDSLPAETLRCLSQAKIKFISALAFNRC